MWAIVENASIKNTEWGYIWDDRNEGNIVCVYGNETPALNRFYLDSFEGWNYLIAFGSEEDRVASVYGISYDGHLVDDTLLRHYGKEYFETLDPEHWPLV